MGEPTILATYHVQQIGTNAAAEFLGYGVDDQGHAGYFMLEAGHWRAKTDADKISVDGDSKADKLIGFPSVNDPMLHAKEQPSDDDLIYADKKDLDVGNGSLQGDFNHDGKTAYKGVPETVEYTPGDVNAYGVQPRAVIYNIAPTWVAPADKW